MASTSNVDIVNRGFAKIDARQISAFSDKIKEGDLATLFYETTRDELLAEHPWRFAMTRVQLSQTTAVSGWDYAHTLPSDLIKIVEMADNNNFYGSAVFAHHREGNTILSYSSTVWLRYVYRFINVTLMPPLFQEALVLRFASYVGPHLDRSRAQSEAHYEQSERTLSKAKSSEAQEEPHEPFPESSWVTTRYGYHQLDYGT